MLTTLKNGQPISVLIYLIQSIQMQSCFGPGVSGRGISVELCFFREEGNLPRQQQQYPHDLPTPAPPP